MESFYDLSAERPDGSSIPMSEFENKVVLVVNTATRCGLAPQFKSLERLHKKYKDQGLAVIGFPCNQFMDQEPESDETMESYCELNYGVSFSLTKKIKVNGRNTHPIFAYLKKHLRSLLGRDIKWNFTKFLVSPEGKPYKRFGPTTDPQKMENDIKKLLGQIQ